MEGKIFFYILILVIMILSVLIGLHINENEVEAVNLSIINNQKIASEFTNLQILERNDLVGYISKISGLSEDVSIYLIEQSKKKKLDIFLVLGLIKLESNFDTYLVGTSGERGLGQVMDITGKAVASNLGIKYDRDKLFEPKYNILLFTTHLKYLFEYYDQDLHKVLTAYNRGQNGLSRYIASRSGIKNPEASAYSGRVLEYYNHFKIKYNN